MRARSSATFPLWERSAAGLVPASCRRRPLNTFAAPHLLALTSSNAARQVESYVAGVQAADRTDGGPVRR